MRKVSPIQEEPEEALELAEPNRKPGSDFGMVFVIPEILLLASYYFFTTYGEGLMVPAMEFTVPANDDGTYNVYTDPT